MRWRLPVVFGPRGCCPASRLGGGELGGGGGMGRGAGRSRGLVGRVPEEHPWAAGVACAAHKYSSAGWLVGLSVSVGDCV